MKKPLISIIVPIYNAEKYIKRCVESILSQSYENIELILVNDGSSDGSLEMCNNYSLNDARVVVINKSNTGVSDTRNRGIDIAKGEYIGFVDADDYVEKPMYEEMLNAMESADLPICCCGFFLDYENDNKSLKRGPLNTTSIIGSKEIFKEYLNQNSNLHIENGNWNKLFRRDLIGDIRYENYAYGEDIDFQSRIFEKASGMICLDSAYYHHVINDSGVSQKSFNKRMTELMTISRKRLDYINESFPEIKKEAESFMITCHLIVAQIILSGKKVNDNSDIIKEIRERICANVLEHIKNPYVKRLDKFYLLALSINMMKNAIKFRNFIVRFK